jgi:hypothetical protein
VPLIKLPANEAEPDGIWRPRIDQQPAWDYLINGGTRLVEIAHRRWGKDELCLAWAAVAAHNRVGCYWHLLPEQSQGRKAIWNAVDPHRGKRRIDLAFPKEIRHRTIENEMFIEFKNGSTWQVVGSDNFDSLVGTPPVGLVFSEFALSNPFAWSYLRPILLENGGWAAFITTSRGRNHAYKLFNFAIKPGNDWFGVMHKADETEVFTAEQLENELAEYIALYGKTMGQALFDQEYLCSWESAVPGSYWGEVLNELERDGRLTDVAHDPNLPVITSDDLGVNDENVKFYWQETGSQIRMIDCEFWRGVGLQTHVKSMKAKPYNYGQSIYPFDIKVRELGTDGKSRYSILKRLGVVHPTIAPGAAKVSRMDGIDAVRRMIPRLWIDREKCGDAFEILKGYKAKWDQERQTLSNQPDHTYHSNWADSVRYFAITPHQTSGEWTEIDYSERNRAVG